jgi:DnaK suppressor protein
MTITEFPSRDLTAIDRDNLREALSHRRNALRSALRLYEGARISAAPRAALADGTRAAIADIDAALAILHRTGYGLCERCRQPLPIHALTLRPLELLCRNCEPLDAA